VATTSPDNVWAVGNTDPGAIFIEHWNGRRWTHVPTPDPSAGGGFMQGLAPVPGGHAWLVGFTKEHLLTLYERWNGSAWH